MANNGQFNCTTTSAVATSTSAKTVLAIVNSSTKRNQLVGLQFSADYGTVTTGSYVLELVEFDQTTAGTATSETVNKVGGTSDTSVVSSVQRNYSVEPTTGTVRATWYVPAGGVYERDWPLGREFNIAASKTVGLRVTAPSGTPNVRATLTWEE